MTDPPSHTWLPPSVLDEFHVQKALGQGAMGQVYLGHDTLLDRHVAVKFISALQPDDRARQRFLTEARAIARLQHPNVVTIYRVGEVDGHPFLVSELVRGSSLCDVDKPMPWSRVMSLAIGAAKGLAAAHRQGVLHRDIKPANMMLTEDEQVKLLDFGLATFSDARAAVPSAAEPEGIVGTPLYMAPEVRGGQPATRRSDVYALGCVLFELCTGRAPLQVALGTPCLCPPPSGTTRTPPGAGIAAPIGEADYSTLIDDRTPDESADGDLPAAVEVPRAPPLLRLVQGIDPTFAGIVDRCLQPDPELRFASAEELWDALAGVPTAVPVGRIPAGNPYRGLLPFDEDHRALFFGRDAEIRVVLERLRTEPLLILAGGSGTGKTSLCRAGVLPLCQEGVLGGDAHWSVVSVSPGRHALRTLAAALAPLLGRPEDELAAELAADPASLSLKLRRRARGQALLLFVDQLEEVFTLGSAEEAALCGEMLAAFDVLGPAVRVLLSIRADFLPRLLSLPGIGVMVGRALHLLRPLGTEGLHEAVVGPARRCGVGFETESLVSTLVQTAQQTTGGLSLLQFALAELWEARDPSTPLITEASLQALGGVTGALTRHADGVLSRLDETGRNQARRIFNGLLDRSGQRRRCTRAELCPDESEGTVLEDLVRGRLVAASQTAGETAYEIVHDALVQEWTTLKEWLDQSAESRAARLRIEAAAAEWERLGRPPEALWQERQLQDVAQVQEADLWPREVAFLAATRRALRRRRLLRQAALLSLPLLGVLAYGGVTLAARRALTQAVASHVGKALPAQSSARLTEALGIARQAEALDRFDRGQGEAAEPLWAEALAQLAKADGTYAVASHELEAALILDPRRSELRRLLSSVTFARIVLLERLHRFGQRDELLHRLPTYDQTGETQRQIAEPATIDVDTQPEGALCTLYRAEGGDFQKERELGRTPLRKVAVAQGSWLLSFTTPGTGGAQALKERARLPILLARGERQALSVYLPAEGQVPPDYAYVPAGDFLYGSADDEALRQGFLHAQPMHRVHTDGFLIGRTEVTFSQWLTFLRALPPAERKRRTPEGSYLLGHLRLQELPDGTYRLNFQPATIEYSALEGEPIRYGQRSRRATQDWLRMPVTAISWEDATVYMAWLDRTSRLHGARLCDEREWERAARGADGRRYPHGDRLLPDDANFDETYGRRPQGFGPDEVGAHPRSQSPFGLMDMTGNVWEQTHEAGDDTRIVLRGGGWYYDQATNRLTNREPVGDQPMRSPLLGLRVCAPVPESQSPRMR